MQKNRKPLTVPEAVLLALAILLLLPGISVFVWYGSTCIPIRAASSFPARELIISDDSHQCTLKIPSGKLTLRRPKQTVVGGSYKMSAAVELDQPLQFSDCSGGLPNWNILMEAQNSFAGASVHPFAAVRQPAGNRERISFDWTISPEEPVALYTSHFWLRVIVTQQDQIVERWDLLVRDYPMRNTALFGQPILFWFIIGGFAIVLGLLVLVLFLQLCRRGRKMPGKGQENPILMLLVPIFCLFAFAEPAAAVSNYVHSPHGAGGVPEIRLCLIPTGIILLTCIVRKKQSR